MNKYFYFGVALLALISWGSYEHSRFVSERSEHLSFVVETKALHDIQEANNASKIAAALSERDASIRRLRDSEVRYSSLRRSLSTESSGRVCYSGEELNRAYRILVDGLRAVAAEGQAGLIDNKAWLQAWPR